MLPQDGGPVKGSDTGDTQVHLEQQASQAAGQLAMSGQRLGSRASRQAQSDASAKERTANFNAEKNLREVTISNKVKC